MKGAGGGVGCGSRGCAAAGSGSRPARARRRRARRLGAGVAASWAPSPLGRASDAAASGSMYATTVPTSTVSPSPTAISTRVPADGAGISASTLSVEISRMGSSRSTASPTCLSHFETVPSAMDSPIWGMGTSIRATLDHSAMFAVGRREAQFPGLPGSGVLPSGVGTGAGTAPGSPPPPGRTGSGAVEAAGVGTWITDWG